MNEEKTKKLLTEKETAKILNLSVITLRNWRFLGRGPRYVKLGRAVRYPVEAIEAFIASHTIEPRKTGN